MAVPSQQPLCSFANANHRSFHVRFIIMCMNSHDYMVTKSSETPRCYAETMGPQWCSSINSNPCGDLLLPPSWQSKCPKSLGKMSSLINDLGFKLIPLASNVGLLYYLMCEGSLVLLTPTVTVYSDMLFSYGRLLIRKNAQE